MAGLSFCQKRSPGSEAKRALRGDHTGVVTVEIPGNRDLAINAALEGKRSLDHADRIIILGTAGNLHFLPVALDEIERAFRRAAS